MNQTANYSGFPDRVTMAVPMFCRYIFVSISVSRRTVVL